MLVVLVGSSLAACSKPRCEESIVSGPAPVDQGLVAYLSMASALHHEADLAEGKNDGPATLAALIRLLEAKTPGTYTEVREVRADTFARAAELSLADPARANGWIEQGLKEVPEESYYRGRLFEVSGSILQHESKQLEAEGKLPEAEAKKRAAIEHLEQAIRIQQVVIERATSPEKNDP